MNQQRTGERPKTIGGRPQSSSVEPLIPLADRVTLAVKAADDLIGLLPPQDVGDPERFMTALVNLLAGYHQRVIAGAADAIATRVDRLTLKAVRDVCDELLAPIARQIQRDVPVGLPAPAKPDQARRDAIIADYQKRVRPLLQSSFNAVPAEREVRQSHNDGKYASRVAADLEARRARNAARQDQEAS